MFVLDSLLVGGLRFVLEQLTEAANREATDDTALRERLLEAQMRLELGEISDQEYARIERDVFERVRRIRGRASSGDLRSTNAKVSGVEVSTADELD